MYDNENFFKSEKVRYDAYKKATIAVKFKTLHFKSTLVPYNSKSKFIILTK